MNLSGRIAGWVGGARLQYLLFLAIIGTATVIRVWIALTQPMYVDEGGIAPESALMIHAVYVGNWRSSAFALDDINPQFTKIFYGFWMSVAYGFHSPPVTATLGSRSVPFRAIVAARLGAVGLNLVVVSWLYLKLRRLGGWFALAVVGAIALNPVALFYTSLELIYALLLPFSLLFLWHLHASRFQANWNLAAAGVAFGLCVSVQYTAALYWIIPIAFCILYTLSRDASAKGITALGLLEVCFYLGSIGFLVFIALNPFYWSDPIARFLYVFGSAGAPLNLPSGVTGVPVLFDGGVHLTTALWVPLADILFLTPLLLVLCAVGGVAVLVRHVQIRQSEAGRLAVLGAAALVVVLPAAAVIEHMHTPEAYTYFLPPTALIAGVGFSRGAAWIGRRLTAAASAGASIERTRTARAHLRLRSPRVATAVVASALTVYLVATAAVLGTSGFGYTNELSPLLGHTGASYDGAWGSPKADQQVASFMLSHGVSNTSVLVLGLTASVRYYDPNNNYVQLWATTNATYLQTTYGGYYLVVDEWYTQLWGNPVPTASPGFPELFSATVPYGQSTLYHIGAGTPPRVTSFSSLGDASRQTVYINGTGFGSSPTLTRVGVGWFYDTPQASSSPAVSFTDFSSFGEPVWSAGLGTDAVGVQIIAWTNTQIVLGGFSPNLGPWPSVPGTYPIEPGDQIAVTVFGPNESGSAYYVTQVRPSTSPGPEITSVSTINASAEQNVEIRGSGFGSDPQTLAVPFAGYVDTQYSNTTPSLQLTDLTLHGANSLGAGLGTDAVGIRIANWTNTAITLSGLSPNAGPNLSYDGQYDIDQGDEIEISVYGPNLTGAAYDIAQVSTANAVRPEVLGTSGAVDSSNQTIVLNGTGFGTSPVVSSVPFKGYSDTHFSDLTPSISIVDYTPENSTRWAAGFQTDAVGIQIESWTPTQIRLGGFSPNIANSSYASTTYLIEPGDTLRVLLYGPNGTGVADAEIPVLPYHGDAPAISSVTAVTDLGKQTIEINGTDLGSAPITEPVGRAGYVDTQFNLTTPSLRIDDYTAHKGSPWEAGFGTDGSGVIIDAWTPTMIVLGGFGPNVGPTNSSTYEILPGDELLITVYGPNSGGPAFWVVFVG